MGTKKTNRKASLKDLFSNDKEATKNAYKVSSLSGSSLRSPVAETGGISPVTYSAKSGTPLLTSIAYSLTAPKYGAVVKAEEVIKKIEEIVADNYSAFPAIKKLLPKNYKNESRLLSDYRNKNRSGLLVYFSTDSKRFGKVRGSFLSDSEFKTFSSIK